MADYLIDGNTVSGWTTIVVVLLLFIGIQMISTGILGEYVARIFEEVKGRPLYVVERELGEGLEARRAMRFLKAGRAGQRSVVLGIFVWFGASAGSGP